VEQLFRNLDLQLLNRHLLCSIQILFHNVDIQIAQTHQHRALLRLGNAGKDSLPCAYHIELRNNGLPVFPTTIITHFNGF
jgi:hypothetical protein